VSSLVALRDDGPLARRLAAALARGGEPGPIAWLVPPLVRAVEYGGLVALTAGADRDAMPACFAFLAVFAFHHYDAVYREVVGRPVPRWVGFVGGGWEVRLLVAGVLAAAGALEVGLVVAAAGLGTVYAAEAVASWIRAGRAGRRDPSEGSAEALE
jgi:Family of unknown function (DUF5941)